MKASYTCACRDNVLNIIQRKEKKYTFKQLDNVIQIGYFAGSGFNGYPVVY